MGKIWGILINFSYIIFHYTKKLGFFLEIPSFLNALKWGGISDSNRCMVEPQSTVLTPSPIPPYKRHIYFISKLSF